MNPTTKNIFITLLTILFIIIGAVAGRLAGPAMARWNPTVTMAEKVWKDERKGETPTSSASRAWRQSGRPSAELYAESRRIEAQFIKGGMWLGIFCGLAAALQIGGLLTPRRRQVYEADPTLCVACARCYEACPIERGIPEELSATSATPPATSGEIQ